MRTTDIRIAVPNLAVFLAIREEQTGADIPLVVARVKCVIKVGVLTRDLMGGGPKGPPVGFSPITQIRLGIAL